MSDTTYLVVGASRGLGQGIVERLSQDVSNRIIATTRKPADFKNGNIRNLVLDQTNPDLVKAAAAAVEQIDVLVVNAAIGDLEYILATSAERLQQYLETNVVGVHRVVEAFLPALRAGKEKKIVIISSSSGSMTIQKGATFGFQGPYSVTKAANNMQVVQYHNELHKDGFSVIAIHPGWVKTDMGSIVQPGAVKPIPISTSADGIVNVIQSLKHDDSGTFFVYDGETMPW